MALPIFVTGMVVKGFGRGSKQLGIPTANLPEDVVNALPTTLNNGVYYGWAKLDKEQPIYKMVMSVGWNPYYHNTKKSMEVHVMQQFADDFYGSTLRVAILGFIREEKNFSSLDELIHAIQEDIRIADEQLNKPESKAYGNDKFFAND